MIKSEQKMKKGIIVFLGRKDQPMIEIGGLGVWLLSATVRLTPGQTRVHIEIRMFCLLSGKNYLHSKEYQNRDVNSVCLRFWREESLSSLHN